MWTSPPSHRPDPLPADADSSPAAPVEGHDVVAHTRNSSDAQVQAAAAVTASAAPADTPQTNSVRRPRRLWPATESRPPRAVVAAAAVGALVGAGVGVGVAVTASQHRDEPAAAPPAPVVQIDNGSGHLGPWQQMGTSRSSSAVDKVAVTDPAGVYLLGDSQARRARTQIFAALTAAKRPVAWDTGNGRPTHGSVDAYLSFLGTQGSPRTLLVLSGTNDVFEPAAFATQVERLLSAAGPGREVYWVTPYVNRPATSAADQRNSQTLRVALEAAAQRHPNLHLVRWGSHLQMLAPAERARLLPDGVHPVPDAAAELARLIAKSMAAG